MDLLASVAVSAASGQGATGRARTHAMIDEYRNLLFAHQTDMNEFLYKLRLSDDYNPSSMSNMYDVIIIGLAASDGTGDILLHKKIMDAVRQIARTLTYVFGLANAEAGHRDEFVQQNRNIYHDFKNEQMIASKKRAKFVDCVEIPQGVILKDILNHPFTIQLVNQKNAPYVIITSAFDYNEITESYKVARHYYKQNAHLLYVGECGTPTFDDDINELPAVSLGFSKSSIGMYYMKPTEFQYDINNVDASFKFHRNSFIFNHIKVSEKMLNDERVRTHETSMYDNISDFENPVLVIYKLLILEIFICIDLKVSYKNIVSIVPDDFEFKSDEFLELNQYLSDTFIVTQAGDAFMLLSKTPGMQYVLHFHKRRVNQDTFLYLMHNSADFVGVTGHNTFLLALSMHKIPLYDCLLHSIPCFSGFTELVNRYVRRDLYVPKISHKYMMSTNVYHILDKYICTNDNVPATFMHVTPFNLHTETFIKVFDKMFKDELLDLKFNIDDNLPLLLAGAAGAWGRMI